MEVLIEQGFEYSRAFFWTLKLTPVTPDPSDATSPQTCLVPAPFITNPPHL